MSSEIAKDIYSQAIDFTSLQIICSAGNLEYCIHDEDLTRAIELRAFYFLVLRINPAHELFHRIKVNCNHVTNIFHWQLKISVFFRAQR